MGLSHFNLRGNKDFNGKEVLKCIRMWITIFKMFIWEGTSSDILSKIGFCSSAHVLPVPHIVQRKHDL